MTFDNSEIIIYQTDDGRTKIDVRMEEETVWLSQAQMAELFQTTKQNVSLHINNAFAEGEFEQDSVVKEYLTTAADGKNYQYTFCMLREGVIRDRDVTIIDNPATVLGPSRCRLLPDTLRIAFFGSSARGGRSSAACSHYRVFHIQQPVIIHKHMDRIGGSSGCAFEPEYLVESHGLLL